MDRNGAHILVIPCMIQSHINPILQFSKRLASKNQIVTLVLPSSSTKRFTLDVPSNSTIRVEHISNGENLETTAVKDHLRPAITKDLSQLIKKLLQSDDPPKVLVYDVAFPWALDIAIEHGLHGAIFFTNSCAVSAVYCAVRQSGQPIPWRGSVDSIPSFPILEENDLPTMVTHDSHLYPELMRLVLDHFSSVQKAKYHLYSSFMELEEAVSIVKEYGSSYLAYSVDRAFPTNFQAVKWMRLQMDCSILTIGPTIPSMYLDKRIERDYDHGLSLFKPSTEAYTKWLDANEVGSVIYVSFGSLASAGKEQVEEIAWGLKNSEKHFLWVMRDSDRIKLPVGFLEGDKGLVLSWCSQLEVLSHKAIGCFMSHCGWNSTIEALSLGVPMVAMPQWTDQLTTAKFVVDVWGVGVRVRVDGKGVGRREEIEACLEEVVGREKGKEMKEKALRFRELAKKTVGEGGSSDNNMEDFIASLSCASSSSGVL